MPEVVGSNLKELIDSLSADQKKEMEELIDAYKSLLVLGVHTLAANSDSITEISKAVFAGMPGDSDLERAAYDRGVEEGLLMGREMKMRAEERPDRNFAKQVYLTIDVDDILGSNLPYGERYDAIVRQFAAATMSDAFRHSLDKLLYEFSRNSR